MDKKVILAVQQAFQNFLMATRMNFRVVESKVGWYILIQFEQLDVEELELIARFIHQYFDQQGKYRHLLPKMGVRDGYLSLSMDYKLCEQVFITEQQ